MARPYLLSAGHGGQAHLVIEARLPRQVGHHGRIGDLADERLAPLGVN